MSGKTVAERAATRAATGIRLTRWARRARIAGLAVAVASWGLIALTNRRGGEFLAFGRASFVIDGGCAGVGYRTEPLYWNASYELGPFQLYRTELFSSWGQYSSSWRPFHLRSTGFRPQSRRHIVVPLWQPLVLAAGVACLAHGYLAGSRRADPARCVGCGYNLVGVPNQDGVLKRPECGAQKT